MAWKIRKHHHHQQQRDRISELPDEILGEILSSIPIKEAVRTSIFSKRWKSAWTLVGAVCIRDRDLYSYSSYLNTLSACFVNFVARVFSHVVALRKLELDCDHVYVDQWIDIVTNKLYAHAAYLDELDLTLSGPAHRHHVVKLPPSIFTSERLVVLKLSFQVEQLLNFSSSSKQKLVVWLPRLKVLHLRQLEALDVSSLENILSGCPVLEELFLKGTMYSALDKDMCVKSSSLKRLTLCFYKSVQIDASNLEQLDVRIGPNFVLSTTLPLLVRLTFTISGYWIGNRERRVGFGNTLIELLTRVPNIKYLSLSCSASRFLFYDGFYQQVMPMFKNLTDLKVGVSFKSWPILPWFLQSLPNLVSLSILADDSEADDSETDDSEADDSETDDSEADTYNEDRVTFNQLQFHGTPPTCSMMTSLHQLDKVELEDFQGWDHEMELVSYLLEKAPFLKKMTFLFTARETAAKASRLHRRIVKLPKASTACEVNCLFYDSKSGLFSKKTKKKTKSPAFIFPDLTD